MAHLALSSPPCFLRPKRRLDGLVPEPTDNKFARNEFAQEIRAKAKGEGVVPPQSNRPIERANRPIRSRRRIYILFSIFDLVNLPMLASRFVIEGSIGRSEGLEIVGVDIGTLFISEILSNIIDKVLFSCYIYIEKKRIVRERKIFLKGKIVQANNSDISLG